MISIKYFIDSKNENIYKTNIEEYLKEYPFDFNSIEEKKMKEDFPFKENHIAAAGGIIEVMAQAFALCSKPDLVKKTTSTANISIQIEVENLNQLQQALDAGATSILLDNFSTALLNEAVRTNQQFEKPAVLEASGGISLANVREIALTGVDRISIGAITKNVQAIDFSMRILSEDIK